MIWIERGRMLWRGWRGMWWMRWRGWRGIDRVGGVVYYEGARMGLHLQSRSRRMVLLLP
jgi:hypothetical protein